MLQIVKLACAWRWFLVLALSLFLFSAQPFSTTLAWAEDKEDKEAEQDFVDEDGDGFEDVEEEPEKARPKPKRLTREEKAKQKAEAKRKKQRDQQVANIANRLGRKKTGYFVVVLETTTYSVGKSKKPVPKLEYDVILEDGRTAAAGKILDHLLDIKRKTPKRGAAANGPPPKGNYKLVGRYDDAGNAEDKRVAAEAKCEQLIIAHRVKIKAMLKKGSGLKGNPL